MSKSTQQLKDGKIVETITRFNDSLTTNTRNSEGFTFARHLINYPDRLVLRPALQQNTDIDDYFAIEYGDFDNDEVLLLGTESATDKLFTGALAENITFSAVANATFEDGSWLFKYKNTAFYYNGTDLNYMIDIWGTPAQTTSYKTLTKATTTSFNLVPPFVHPTDDYAYFFDRNNIYQLTDEPGTGTWTQASITIPTDSEISSACPFGEYIAIFAKEINSGNSTVYIWDRSLTLETFVDVKSWIGQEVYASGTVGGNLIGVSLNYATPADRSIIIAGYTGSGVQTLNQIAPNNRGGGFAGADQEEVGIDNTIDYFHPRYFQGKLYFPGFTDIDGKGLVYEVDENYEVRIPYNNGGVSPAHIALMGRGVFMVSNEDKDFFYIKNLGSINLTTNGEYITTIFDGNNGYIDKQPDTIRVWHTPILTSGSVKVEYWCVPNDTANSGGWVTVGTNSTAGKTYTEFNRIASTGLPLNQAQEFYYRITINRVSAVYGFQVDSHFVNNKQ